MWQCWGRQLTARLTLLEVLSGSKHIENLTRKLYLLPSRRNLKVEIATKKKQLKIAIILWNVSYSSGSFELLAVDERGNSHRLSFPAHITLRTISLWHCLWNGNDLILAMQNAYAEWNLRCCLLYSSFVMTKKCTDSQEFISLQDIGKNHIMP